VTIESQSVALCVAASATDPLLSPTDPLPTSGHPHEINARKALAGMVRDFKLPTTVEEMLVWAYEFGEDGNPYDGYRKIEAAAERSLAGSRDVMKVLRSRLSAKTP